MQSPPNHYMLCLLSLSLPSAATTLTALTDLNCPEQPHLEHLPTAAAHVWVGVGVHLSSAQGYYLLFELTWGGAAVWLCLLDPAELEPVAKFSLPPWTCLVIARLHPEL